MSNQFVNVQTLQHKMHPSLNPNHPAFHPDFTAFLGELTGDELLEVQLLAKQKRDGEVIYAVVLEFQRRVDAGLVVDGE